jgi:hypothetical protein
MDMSIRARQIILNSLVLTWIILVQNPWANAHYGGFIVQLLNGRVVIGQDSEEPEEEPSFNTRAVGSQFAPGQFSDLPSFLSLATPPTGTQSLPPQTEIYWDFLPMTTGGYTSNLLYWDGVGTTEDDVEFGPVPVAPPATDVSMGLFNITDLDENDELTFNASVSDTPDMLVGSLLGRTNPVGSGLRLHRHNVYMLEDHDGDPFTTLNVAEGVYLIAMQLRMTGYGTSRPFFVVPGTFELVSESLESLDAAVSWVEKNATLLIRDGDYNFDGDVDSADLATWTQQFGFIGPWGITEEMTGVADFADGNRDSIVDAADYVISRKFAGVGPGAFASNLFASVPEPSSLVVVGWIAAVVMLTGRKRS